MQNFRMDLQFLDTNIPKFEMNILMWEFVK